MQSLLPLNEITADQTDGGLVSAVHLCPNGLEFDSCFHLSFFPEKFNVLGGNMAKKELNFRSLLEVRLGF